MSRTRNIKKKRAGERPASTPHVKARLVERAFQILFTLGSKPEGCGLGELSRLSGLPSATTLRILRTLAGIHVIDIDPVNRQYRLGPALHRLATTSFEGMHLVRIAHPFLEELRDLTKETTCLFRVSGQDRLCVASARSERELSFSMMAGQRRSILIGAPSKLLLAYMSDEKRASLMAGLPKRDRRLLETHCRKVAERGVAYSQSELVPGGAGLSVPIFDHSGEVAALTILGPAIRLTQREAERITPLLQTAAREISKRLGSAPRAFRPLGERGARDDVSRARAAKH
jgi:DNA-binding IclR family transcriptional regulator